MGKLDPGMENMLDMFVFETSDLLEKLDDILMRTESDELGADDVGEIFRIMHTVKGSAAMMGLHNMSGLAHALEDLFSLIREDPSISYDKPALYELLYEGSDDLKNETESLSDESVPLSDFSDLTARIHRFADVMKGTAPAGQPETAVGEGAKQPSQAGQEIYSPTDADDVFAFKVIYQSSCMMPELRAMVLLNQLATVGEVLSTIPPDLDADDAGERISASGFFVKLRTDKPEEVLSHLSAGLNVESAEPVQRPAPEAAAPPAADAGQSSDPGDQKIYSPADAPDVFAYKVIYQSSCMMPELRAMVLLNQLASVGEVLSTLPPDLDADNAGERISAAGFLIKLRTDKPEEALAHIRASLNVESALPIARPSSGDKDTVKKPAAAPTSAAPAAPAKPAAKKQQEEKGSAVISVKLDKLDRLMRLTQELVIAESGVLHSKTILKQRKRDTELDKACRELKKLSDELQDNVMAVRMVPISGAFSRMNRIIRDMNKTLGKGVKLIMEGESTEVDKSVADMLGDPLMHLVRNAVDHGIETPEERKASGKTEEPAVTLAAFYDSGDVVVTVTDNGGGMDPAVLLRKGREKGILTKPENEYTEQDCFELIMAAGFSTNTEVTEYSGRGVGMDVVKKNLEKVGGKLLVTSKLGKGSVFTIRVPMSLSISDCLGFMLGGQEYALPTQTMTEAFRADKELIVCTPDGKENVRRRGEKRLYRVIRLSRCFGIENAEQDLEKGIMIICSTGRGAAALFVDELTEDMQLVVKPFSPYLSSLGLREKGMAGTSVLGDGSILLVIDPAEIMKGGDK